MAAKDANARKRKSHAFIIADSGDPNHHGPEENGDRP
jgi:hypothetical protein